MTGIVLEIVAITILLMSIILDSDILGTRTDSVVLMVAIIGIFFIATTKTKNQK
jgi:hypothetical protein